MENKLTIKYCMIKKKLSQINVLEDGKYKLAIQGARIPIVYCIHNDDCWLDKRKQFVLYLTLLSLC